MDSLDLGVARLPTAKHADKQLESISSRITPEHAAGHSSA
jgi:hypothetical protein